VTYEPGARQRPLNGVFSHGPSDATVRNSVFCAVHADKL
jgi:hypothetical protein